MLTASLFLKHSLNIFSIIILLLIAEAAGDLQPLWFPFGNLFLQKTEQIGLPEGDQCLGGALSWFVCLVNIIFLPF